MEISGVVFRPVQSFSGDLFDTHSSKPSFSGRSINAGRWVSGDLRLDCSKKLKSLGFSNSGFCNNRRLQCYVSPICGGKKKEKKREKVKEKEEEKREIKKKRKLVKGLWKNLSMYSEMEFLDIDKEGSDGSEQGKIMSKASEILLVQLLQLRAEEKELKRKQKAEKAKLKASIKMIKPSTLDSEPSSSSSSNAECREVINMNSMGSSSTGILELPITIEPKVVVDDDDELNVAAIQEEKTTDLIITNSSLSTTGEQKKITLEEDHILMSSSEKSCNRIDVCMGGKCKKMGSEALLEELKNRVGIEGAVVGCKCMGKCKNSPNVRVVSKSWRDKNASQGKDSSSSSSSSSNNNPLYLGVGLEDVGAIVANFLGGEGGGGGEQEGFGFC